MPREHCKVQLMLNQGHACAALAKAFQGDLTVDSLSEKFV